VLKETLGKPGKVHLGTPCIQMSIEEKKNNPKALHSSFSDGGKERSQKRKKLKGFWAIVRFLG